MGNCKGREWAWATAKEGLAAIDIKSGQDKYTLLSGEV